MHMCEWEVILNGKASLERLFVLENVFPPINKLIFPKVIGWGKKKYVLFPRKPIDLYLQKMCLCE